MIVRRTAYTLKSKYATTSLVAVSLCMSVALSLSFSMGLPGLAADKTIADADQFLLEGKLEQAEDAYRNLIKSDETGDAHAGLAVALAKQSWPAKIIEAEKLLKQAKEKFSDN